MTHDRTCDCTVCACPEQTSGSEPGPVAGGGLDFARHCVARVAVLGAELADLGLDSTRDWISLPDDRHPTIARIRRTARELMQIADLIDRGAR